MTKEKFDRIESLINENIWCASAEFNSYGQSEYYKGLIHKIHGMIEILQLVTDKEYYFDENGIHEKGDTL